MSFLRASRRATVTSKDPSAGSPRSGRTHHPDGGGWFRMSPDGACPSSGVKEPRRADTPAGDRSDAGALRGNRWTPVLTISAGPNLGTVALNPAR